MERKCLVVLFGFLLLISLIPVRGQDSIDIKELAVQIAGKSGASLERTKLLVDWINENFDFTYTDYKKRTVEEIIQRRGGNCAEQARVLQAFLVATAIHSRWVAEINIQPKSERRKKDAADLIEKEGNTFSVFGYMHNDHRWLEVYDDKAKQWIPADPSLGILGTLEWIATRVGFDKRPEAVEDMIVPFVVVVRNKGRLIEDRSDYYLIQEFNRYYDGKLEASPDWKEWVSLIEKLSKLGASAFDGEVNLHNHTDLMERLHQVYMALKKYTFSQI